MQHLPPRCLQPRLLQHLADVLPLLLLLVAQRAVLLHALQAHARAAGALQLHGPQAVKVPGQGLLLPLLPVALHTLQLVPGLDAWQELLQHQGAYEVQQAGVLGQEDRVSAAALAARAVVRAQAPVGLGLATCHAHHARLQDPAVMKEHSQVAVKPSPGIAVFRMVDVRMRCA